ncbi:hypothetical protein AVEN_168938-1 [Araneus ventricosus]|uniref:Uncharacterized protein n=1 Tax=Araneus ventricosus TaxID=182803 RepID=A0A4Y2WSQ7_ARAVE|nr:hypothetical protein AVEN_133151-1 [Araneus ventricosus]GBO38910.1 hypothetical protein AVEN_182756-1 [Araneus ventricosus]GBO42575.1 hypothetical protein AVEN_265846-1 [Araneus ventricosus]GBO42580.1 hypothetical protein AVEN_168938-1 [Araneus ventricosus]
MAEASLERLNKSYLYSLAVLGLGPVLQAALVVGVVHGPWRKFGEVELVVGGLVVQAVAPVAAAKEKKEQNTVYLFKEIIDGIDGQHSKSFTLRVAKRSVYMGLSSYFTTLSRNAICPFFCPVFSLNSADTKYIDQKSCLTKRYEFVFTIPAHHANVERIFSQLLTQWSDERNRLSVETFEGILICHYNLDITCAQFYNYVREDNDITKEAESTLKYDWAKKD